MLKILAHLEHLASAYSERYTQYLAQWHIFMYIKAYSEYMVYSGIFTTGDIVVSFRQTIQVLLRSNFCII